MVNQNFTSPSLGPLACLSSISIVTYFTIFLRFPLFSIVFLLWIKSFSDVWFNRQGEFLCFLSHPCQSLSGCLDLISPKTEIFKTYVDEGKFTWLIEDRRNEQMRYLSPVSGQCCGKPNRESFHLSSTSPSQRKTNWRQWKSWCVPKTLSTQQMSNLNECIQYTAVKLNKPDPWSEFVMWFLAALAALYVPWLQTYLPTDCCGLRVLQTKPDQTFLTYLHD